MICEPRVQTNKAYLMHNSDSVLIQNCAFDSPCLVHWGSDNYLFKNRSFKDIGYESKHVCFSSCSFWAEA